MKNLPLLFALLIGSPSFARAEESKCPPAVTAAIEKAFPKSTILKCKAEKEHGHEQFEVKLTKQDGQKVEADVSPEGKLVQVEERIAVDKLPAAVAKAFAAKYPKAKATGAEKQTPSDGKPTYEIAFDTDKGKKEVTFAEDGTFIEEE